MSKTSPHNKIINSVARAKLKPLGFEQKGRSRVWYDDRRWHVIGIEFQPSGFSKGSYLNVFISWLWYPNESWSFNVPYRSPSWVDFLDESQFQQDFDALADEAIELTSERRANYDTLESSYEMVRSDYEEMLKGMDADQLGTRQGCWPEFDLGLLAALTGREDKAEELLGSVASAEVEHEWQVDRKNYLDRALPLIARRERFRSLIEANILNCRSLRRMPSLEPPFLPTN